jgi:hypothetical protein
MPKILNINVDSGESVHSLMVHDSISNNIYYDLQSFDAFKVEVAVCTAAHVLNSGVRQGSVLPALPVFPSFPSEGPYTAEQGDRIPSLCMLY